jgi:hypothetical protein
MADVFDRILRDYNALVTRHEEERDRLLGSIAGSYGVKEGLLGLLKEKDLGVHRLHLGQIVVSRGKMNVYVMETGEVSLHLGTNGEIVDFRDERFKQLYAHLNQIYEAQEKRKREEKPLPF